MSSGSSPKPNLLAIVPPYALWGPPAGAAALLGYLKAAGCYDFSFLDLRLFAPDVTTPTYRTVGAFGESFVLDIPDLPLVLSVLDRFARGEHDLAAIPDEVMEPYCLDRGLNSLHVRDYLRRMDRLVDAVFKQIPELNFVGLSVWTSNYLTTLLAAAHLKRRKRPPFVVVGGPQVSQSAASAQLGLRAGLFDAVAIGEGEQTLLDLYGQYSPSRAKVERSVGGLLTYDASANAFQSTPRPLLKLKDLPLPDFDEMHLPAYSIGGKRVVSYQLSRGCTDKCAFCSEWVFWQRFRLTDMDRAVADVAELQRRWGAERVWFTDSLLNGSVNRLKDFATGLINAGIRVDWSGYMRAQIDSETAQLLRRSGCVWVFIGVESLADDTLELMNKRRTESQNLDAVQAFLDAGIQVKVGLIPGFPGDTPERFIRTVRLMRKMQASSRLLGVSHEAFVVLPGQPIYRDLEKFGLRPIAWSDAVLDVAPDLKDIASRSWCRVEGDNQGLSRLGEYAISLSLTGPGEPFDRDTDHFREPITPYDLTLTPLGGDTWLGRTITAQGHTVAVLLTTEERAWLLDHGPTQERIPRPLCDTEDIGIWFRGLLARHRVASDLQAPVVASTRYRKLDPSLPSSGEARLSLGPFSIVRKLGERLWIANVATAVATSVPAVGELGTSILCNENIPVSIESVELAEQGLLVYLDLPVVCEAAPGELSSDSRPKALALTVLHN